MRPVSPQQGHRELRGEGCCGLCPRLSVGCSAGATSPEVFYFVKQVYVNIQIIPFFFFFFSTECLKINSFGKKSFCFIKIC